MATKIAEQIVDLEVWLENHVSCTTECVDLDMVEFSLKQEGIKYAFEELNGAINSLIRQNKLEVVFFHSLPSVCYIVNIQRYKKPQYDAECPL